MALGRSRAAAFGAAGWAAALAAAAAPMAARADTAEIERGAQVYGQTCARCHGADLKGEPGWETIGPDGRTKAPPHDESGHTWMHSEAELFRWVRTGLAEVVAPGRVSDMPAFAGKLSDDDIRAVLAFIQSRWQPGYQAFQLLLDPALDPARLPPGDWRLPKTCQPAPGR